MRTEKILYVALNLIVASFMTMAFWTDYLNWIPTKICFSALVFFWGVKVALE